MTTTATTTCPSWCALPAGHDLDGPRDVSGATLREHVIKNADLIDMNGDTFVVDLRRLDVVDGDGPHSELTQVYVDAHPLTSAEARKATAALLTAGDLLDSESICASGKPREHLDADPDSSEWGCRVPDVPNVTTLVVTPFDHSRGVPEHTGHRGVKLDATTRFTSGRVFSTDFPTVFVADSGDVEIGEDLRIPREDAAEWFRAVADYLAGGPGAPETVAPHE